MLYGCVESNYHNNKKQNIINDNKNTAQQIA